MLPNILDRISFWALFVVIVLLPIFCLPFTQIPIETSKGLLLVVGLAISVIFWIVARFSDGKVSIPRSRLLLSGLLILLVVLVSAIFSSTLKVSLFGIMFDIGTFYFMLGAFLLMLFSSVVLKDKRNAMMVFWGVIASSTVLFIFQGLHIFIPNATSLGILGEKTDTILGSWNALGLFSGFSTIMALFIMEFFPVPKFVKWLLGILVLFSMVLSMAVNFSLVWQLLGIFALIIFVYKVSLSFGKKQEDQKTHFPAFSFVVVMVSLLFCMSSQFIGEFLPNHLGLSNVEVRPSFMTTVSVAKQALMKDPVLGTGPNKFGEIWAMYKPIEMNTTQFWDTSFNSGSGTLPTFISTTGILGLLSWIIFFLLFIAFGMKALFSSIKNNANWEVVTFFVASLYLFISSFLYSTGSVIFLLAFAFTGIFIGLYSSSRQKEITISFLDDPRKSFFSILFLVILMIVSAAVGFKYVERLASVSYYGDTLSASTIADAEKSILKTLSLYQNDLYLRTYAQVYLTKINSIVSKGASSLSEADKSDLQASFDQAVSGAQSAVAFNPANYLNYNSLGAVYNTVGVLGVKDAYIRAIEAYTSAEALNPLNPGIKLSKARVYLADGKIKDARDLAKKALELKSNYVDAFVTLAQIEKSDGNNNLAVSYAESALSLMPDNKELSDYVNSLKNGASSLQIPSSVDNTKTKQ